MNVRPPMAAGDEFLSVQDAFLQEETKKKGIIELADLKLASKDSRLYLWQGDITRLHVDAITNACNDQTLGCFLSNHGCIDNIEHTMAGIQMRLECNRQMELQGHAEEVGKCKITPGYNLPAKYVLHTVGPNARRMLSKEHINALESCYRQYLKKEDEYGCESVSFCCISTGVFRFPQNTAAKIAVNTVTEWLNEHPSSTVQKVVFNVFKDYDRELYAELLK